MTIRKITGLLLCLVLALSVAGCANEENETEAQAISTGQIEASDESAVTGNPEDAESEKTSEPSETEAAVTEPEANTAEPESKEITDEVPAAEPEPEKAESEIQASDTEAPAEQAGQNTEPESPESAEPSTEPVEPAEQEKEEGQLKLYFNNTEIPVTWENNATVSELIEEASKGDITVSMSMYGGWEQVGSLGRSYTRNDSQMTTLNGDIVLYSGNQIVVFYGSNSWSYTKLGKMNLSEDKVTELLSNGNITLTLRY